MSQPESFPINSVARNSVWVYDAYSQPRFGGAPTIVERARNYQMPDFGRLRLDGVRRRRTLRRGGDAQA